MKLVTLGFLAIVACGGTVVETQSVAPTPSTSPAPSTTPAPSQSPSASPSIVAVVRGKPIAIPQLHLAGAAVGKVGSINVHPGAGGATTVDTDAFNVDVNAPGQFDPKTIEQARAHARSYSGHNDRAESLPDGWAFTFDNDVVFFGNVYRVIGGNPYFCTISQPNAERRDRAVAFCKSLTAR
ncbi:MAG TPA: hypothetical protein VGH28_27735 [Polyangiaceae bacterium]|jgi:hypothetical protein